jgi:hypothetical protein
MSLSINVPTTNASPLSQRITKSFSQLSAAAACLNAASDELGKWISYLESSFKQLNLGLPAWVEISTWRDDTGMSFITRQLGYDKIDGKWGIALKSISGNEDDPDNAHIELWLFNDGPRWLRLEAADKFPNLIDKLVEEANALAQQIKEKVAVTQEIANAIAPQAAKRK